MDVYVKDKRTFLTKSKLNCYDYTAVNSIFDTNSSFSVIANGPEIAKGDFLICVDLDFICIIDQIKTTPGSLEVELTCGQIVNIFNRKLFAVSGNQIATSVELFIKTKIEEHFLTLTDNYFRLPFLVITKTSDTASSMIIDYEEELWNLKSFITKARRLADVQLTYTVDANHLVINISRITNAVAKLDFTDPRITLESETLSQRYISKIQVYCKESSATTCYYKLSDGRFSADESNAMRIEGEWETLIIDKIAEITDKVTDAFAKNTYSHLVEFSVEKNSYYHTILKFYQNTEMRLKNGDIVTSYITGITQNSSDNLVHYKSGELRTKLTDKLTKGGIK